METKIDTAGAVKTCKTLSEKNKISVKVLKCEQDGHGLTFYYLTPERSDLRPLSRDLNRQYKVKINFRELTTQEAASLIPGYGPCGTRICWQSGACGHLWDCTCDPTASKDKGNDKEVEVPEGSKSPDLSGENQTSENPPEISVNQESRGGGEIPAATAEPAPAEPVQPAKKPNKKFIRRLVIK